MAQAGSDAGLPAQRHACDESFGGALMAYEPQRPYLRPAWLHFLPVSSSPAFHLVQWMVLLLGAEVGALAQADSAGHLHVDVLQQS